MKKLTCEMCGNTDLIKENNVFVCQYCGTKYSVEEAKKMMIEGTVDVQGVVKVDASDELKNLYQIARRAKEENNSENAAKYYEMILIKDPTSWEASFFTVYFKAMSCTIAQISSACDTVRNCIVNVLTLIKQTVDTEEEQVAAVIEVAHYCISITGAMCSGATHSVSTDASSFNIAASRCVSAVYILYELGDKIESIFENCESLREVSALSWKGGIQWHGYAVKWYRNNAYKENSKKIILQYAEKIKKYDPTYQLPNKVTENLNSGGCYVATCVYGSYDCPQVWTLRRYRDYTLAETWRGRAFIHLYYAISPKVVKIFGNKKWFKKIWKSRLDKMVDKLRAQGVADTPYRDRRW